MRRRIEPLTGLDRTAIIWKDFKKTVRIEGHEQAIWAVRFVGEDRVLTGEPDAAIISFADSHP